jgi:prepilin-type N-terminal cleavage/methylation domain-containing protein
VKASVDDRGPRRTLLGADAGFTLAEVVVSVAIMSVFLTVFTGGILQMFRMTNKSESAAIAQSQLTVVFQRLDKEIRYATAIDSPGTGPNGTDQYVQYVVVESGVSKCRQLQLTANAELLQIRSWTRGALPAAPSAWTTLASGVTSVPGTMPFMLDPAPAVNHQRLQIRLVARSGSGGSGTSVETRATWTALNTTADEAPSQTGCAP